MQNRKPNTHQHEEMTFAQFSALKSVHNELHSAELAINLQEAFYGPSLETEIGKMMVAENLEMVHEEMDHHLPEIQEQQAKLVDNLTSKKADVDAGKVEQKNATKEVFAAKQGLFSQAIVARRAEVEAMLDASAQKSAPNSDTEEVSSVDSPSMSLSRSM